MKDVDLTEYAGRLDIKFQRFNPHGGGFSVLVYDAHNSDKAIATVYAQDYSAEKSEKGQPETIALARLFAYAPEMLEVLNQAVVYVAETMFDVDKTNLERKSAVALYERMREIVAKAQGWEHADEKRT